MKLKRVYFIYFVLFMLLTVLIPFFASAQGDAYEMAEVEVIAGSRPHDVAPDPEHERVWYTAQRDESLGLYIPSTGEVRHIHLGSGSAPHGVIVGPDGAAWITDGGLNAIVRVHPDTEDVEVFPLPAEFPNANLNTATFDGDGILWFTGQTAFTGALTQKAGR
jgi:virginiamycin B lyase